MIQRKMPADIMQYEAKAVGPFTTRQLICFVLSGIIGALVISFLDGDLLIDIKILITLVAISPFILIGWVKINGLHFEQYFLTFLGLYLLSPTKRRYTAYSVLSLKECENKKPTSTKKVQSKAKKAKTKISKRELYKPIKF